MSRPPFALRPLLLLLLATPVLAQQSPVIDELPPTAIVAEPPAAPAVSETKAQMLEQRQIRSFDDLGRRAEPGVNFNRSSDSINIRGLEQTRVLTTIDGIRLPWLNDGARGAQGGLDTVDFNGLSRLDIVRGAGSAEAGSGALGGALHLFTLNPADLLGEGKDFGTLLKTDYDSAEHSYGLNGALAARHGGSAWLLQVGGRRGHELKTRGSSGGYGSTRSKANPMDSKQHSLLLKFQQQLGAHQLGLTAEYFERENDIDSRTNQGGSYLMGQNSTNEVARRERLSLNWKFNGEQGALIDQAQSTVYWQRLRRHDDQRGIRVAAPDGRANIPDAVFIFGFGLPGNPYKPLAAGYPSGPFGRDNQIEKELWGFSGKLDKGFNLVGKENRLTLGAELYRIDTEQYSKGYDNCPPLNIPAQVVAVFGPAPCALLHSSQADMPKSEGTHVALYASDEIHLSPRVAITPALRFDQYEEKPKTSGAFKSNVQPVNSQTLSKSRDHKLSASLLSTFQVSEQTLLYAQIAQGFRAPEATELYMNYGAEGNYLVLGNAKLKPEESTNYEIGSQFGDEKLGGKVSLFDSRYKNFINPGAVPSAAELAAIGINPADYPLGVTRTQNLERVRIFGSELAAHWGFTDSLKLWGQAALARGKERDSGQYLNSVAPLTALLGLSLEQQEYGSDLMLRTAAARNKTANANDFKAPGYGVVDMTVYLQPAALGGVRLQAGLFNAFNKKYWNAISVPGGALTQPADYYSESGRSIRAAIVWQY